MATNTGKERLSPSAEMASSEADAKMVVATSRGDCQKLKDLVCKQDATTMLGVMSSSNQVSQKAAPATMHPLLAAAACRGNWVELNFLLNREGSREHPSWIFSEEFRNQLDAYSSGGDDTIRSSAKQQANGGVHWPELEDLVLEVESTEWSAPRQVLNIESLLDGVTVEGNTALHVVAANGDGQDFLHCADLIHDMDRGLLSKQNHKGDTPLHCAARSGNSQMVRHLIDLATRDNIVVDLLRQGNSSKETVLHEAVRIQDDKLVKDLLAADRRLASFPQEGGTSPLYLAILLRAGCIVLTLFNGSETNFLSTSGPDRQNVLHAAILRDTGLTREVLKRNRNKDLTTERDVNGSTPLHFAAGYLGARQRGSVCSQVFEANTAALYQPDNDGLYPIHVAAAIGSKHAIAMFVKECPRSAGLRDTKGRTFLHVAVVKKKAGIVGFACRDRSLAWILNMQDNDGNTALHLAVKAGSLIMFCALSGNRQVHLSLTNMEGKTPLDIARYKVPPIMHYSQNSEVKIHRALFTFGAWIGTARWDHFWEKYDDIHADKQVKQLEDLKDSTQTLCIGSVLVATVTFGATFALPGGYRADDHPNGGTPTLAGRYAFDAFMMANTIAFICSSIATVGFMYSGSALVHLRSRKFYFRASVYFIYTSITALSAAFALAVHMVLGPVTRKTAIAICATSPLVVLFSNAEFLWKWAKLFRPYCVRMGPAWTFKKYTVVVLGNIIAIYWPLMAIFGWAAYARRH